MREAEAEEMGRGWQATALGGRMGDGGFFWRGGAGKKRSSEIF